jgi:hypothetical protein
MSSWGQLPVSAPRPQSNAPRHLVYIDVLGDRFIVGCIGGDIELILCPFARLDGQRVIDQRYEAIEDDGEIMRIDLTSPLAHCSRNRRSATPTLSLGTAATASAASWKWTHSSARH